MATASELNIDTSASAVDMAQTIFGGGVNVLTASYTGHSSASGTFTGGDTTSPGVIPTSDGVILSTGKAEDFTRSSGDPNKYENETTRHGLAGDSDLDTVSGQTTYDAAVLEATFEADNPILSMQFVFSSEEYLEYVNGGFNDAFAVWVNGTKVDLTVGNGDVSIDNINSTTNSNLYVDNPRHDDLYNTEMDGFTVVLSLKAPVNTAPGSTNTIKIAIADAGDDKWDSNLLIMGDSIQTEVIVGDDLVQLEPNGTRNVDVLANDTTSGGGTLTITHINGQAVVAGSTVTLPTGEQITLNADGTFTIEADGDEGENVFTYTVEDSDGDSDTGYVTVQTDKTYVPCFTRGTRILTEAGEIPVEALRPGMMVMTADHGLQPVRWTGSYRTRARDRAAPVVFAPGALGNSRSLAVSPQHRMVLSGWRAEMLFGAHEVLVAAIDLVNDRDICRRADGSAVDYFHILFDRHEIVFAEGTRTESFHPGAGVLGELEERARAEILGFFPDLATTGYGPPARLPLRSFEARALAA